ncbi:MAG: rhomboid family intramembrane serine protease [Blastocatellia bacterium]
MTLDPINREQHFRTCSACGNQTPAELAACVHCGATLSEDPVAAVEAAKESRFLRAVFTRPNPFAMIFIGINVGVFVLMALAGGLAMTSVDPVVLLGFGAKQNTLIAGQQQYWRLITSIFIHIGFIHLFLNNYALWIIGQEIERIYGSARFVVLYLFTGVIGSLGSYVFNPEATSAGASGAIFGLFGVMATFAFKYRKEIPDLLSREIKRRVLPIIAINLVFGFSVQIVDNAAHIGGLLAGIALALIVPYKRPNERKTPVVWQVLQIICMSVILVSFLAAFRSYSGPGLGISNLTKRPGSQVVTYFENMRDANRSLGESLNSFSSVNSRSRSADVKPSMDSADRGLRAIHGVPSINSDADQYRQRLLDLLNEHKSVLEEFDKANTKSWDGVKEREGVLIERYNQFVADYSKWLPGFLKEHGYELEGRER